MPKEGILLAVSSEIPVESCFFRKSSIILGVGFDGKYDKRLACDLHLTDFGVRMPRPLQDFAASHAGGGA